MGIDWSTPLKEGWEVFDSDLRGFEIQRDDEANLIANDEEALKRAESFYATALRLYPDESMTVEMRNLKDAIKTSQRHLQKEQYKEYKAERLKDVHFLYAKQAGGGPQDNDFLCGLLSGAIDAMRNSRWPKQFPGIGVFTRVPYKVTCPTCWTKLRPLTAAMGQLFRDE